MVIKIEVIIETKDTDEANILEKVDYALQLVGEFYVKSVGTLEIIET